MNSIFLFAYLGVLNFGLTSVPLNQATSANTSSF